MKKEIISVGGKFYVINDRLSKIPELVQVTDAKVIALRKKEGRTAYATPELDSDSMFADGPFDTFNAAMEFIEHINNR